MIEHYPFPSPQNFFGWEIGGLKNIWGLSIESQKIEKNFNRSFFESFMNLDLTCDGSQIFTRPIARP